MIQTKDVRVDYDDVTAVADLNLSIGAGEVYGLIGPNGAGKTSTIRVLATLAEPTYGEVTIAGYDVAEEPAHARRVLGYMPDLAPVYEDLRCWEVLDLFGAAHGVGRRERMLRIDELLEKVNLAGKRDAMAGTLSRGMRQRLILAKTLLHRPRVLLLDEPASGLDPIARIDLRNVLRDLAADGCAVLVSSHILSELSGFCTSIGIMEKGRLVKTGRLETIVKEMRARKRLVIEPIGPPERAAALLGEMPGVIDVHRNGDAVVELDLEGDDAAAAAVLRRLIEAGVDVKSFAEKKVDIEAIMLEVGAREVS